MTAQLQTGPRSAARASDCALEEQHLLQRVRDGDEQAFATLLDRYHPALVQLALVFVRNRPAAEELVQDIWFEVARGVDPVDGRSSLKLWLARALMNRVRSTASTSLSGPRPARDRYVD
jgi:DNA-directed RNA polymerase specialized sigma24 family protein